MQLHKGVKCVVPWFRDIGGVGSGPAPPLDFWFCSEDYLIPSGGRSSSCIMDWIQARSGCLMGSMSSGADFMNMGTLSNS